jgi:hypothetical protein
MLVSALVDRRLHEGVRDGRGDVVPALGRRHRRQCRDIFPRQSRITHDRVAVVRGQAAPHRRVLRGCREFLFLFFFIFLNNFWPEPSPAKPLPFALGSAQTPESDSGNFPEFWTECPRPDATRPDLSPDGMTTLEAIPANRQYSVRQHHELVLVEWADGDGVTLQSMLRMWTEVIGFSRVRRLKRVLFDGRSPLRDMKPIDAFRHGSLLSALGPPGLRVAFCLYDFAAVAVTWLFSRTANDGASAVELFSDLPASLRWIGTCARRMAFQHRRSLKKCFDYRIFCT